jgi:hypothetical protein
MSVAEEIELFAITGLDRAIIGTTLKNGSEVLCYDYDKSLAIVVDAGFSEEHAHIWIETMASRNFEGAPTFIHVGSPQETHDLDYSDGITIH